MSKYSIYIFISIFFLASCGGGGGGSSPAPTPTPSNQAPVISSSATFSAAENQTSIGSVTASDPDGNSLTYSISGTEINISSTGVLTFASAPDYETKNSYTATVTVSDGSLSATQEITVNVTNLIGDIEGKEFELPFSYEDYEEIVYQSANYLIGLNSTGEGIEDGQYVFVGYKLPLVDIFSFSTESTIRIIPKSFYQVKIGDYSSGLPVQGSDLKFVDTNFKILKNYFENEDAIVISMYRNDRKTNSKVLIIGISLLFEDPIDFRDHWDNDFSSFSKIDVIKDSRGSSYFASDLRVGDFDGDNKDDLFIGYGGSFNSILLSNKRESVIDLNQLSSGIELTVDSNGSGGGAVNTYSASFSLFNSLSTSDGQKENLFIPAELTCNYSTDVLINGNNQTNTSQPYTNFISGISLMGQIVSFSKDINYGLLDTANPAPTFDTTAQNDCDVILGSQFGDISSSWIFIRGIGYANSQTFNTSHNPYYKDAVSIDLEGKGSNFLAIPLQTTGPQTYDTSFSVPPYSPGKPAVLLLKKALDPGINIFDIDDPQDFSIVRFPKSVSIDGIKNLGDLNEDGYEELLIVTQGTSTECSVQKWDIILKGTNQFAEIDEEKLESNLCNQNDDTWDTTDSSVNSENYILINKRFAKKYSLSSVIKGEIIKGIVDMNGDGKKEIISQGNKIITPLN